MIILGIDPGSRFLGFAALEVSSTQPLSMKALEYGVLKFNAEEDLSNRLLEIGEGVRELMKSYKPDHMSLEKIFLGKNADSAFKMGHARGVVIYEALKSEVEVYEYATRVVKKGITGNGGAEKEHVRLVVQNLLKLPPVKSLDASDALAMAAFHATQLRFQAIKKTMAKHKKEITA
jgi:crossover junction endodeoxyribonuclease RuvC